MKLKRLIDEFSEEFQNKEKTLPKDYWLIFYDEREQRGQCNAILRILQKTGQFRDDIVSISRAFLGFAIQFHEIFSVFC